MPDCIRCGTAISEQQYDNFKGKCPVCAKMGRKKYYESFYNIKSLVGLLFLLGAVFVFIILPLLGF